MYAFVMFSLLSCATASNDQGCPASTTIPVLILWTFVCAFFREVGVKHRQSVSQHTKQLARQLPS